MPAKNYPKLFLLASLAVVFLVLSLPACKSAPPPPPPVVSLPPIVEPEQPKVEAYGLPYAADSNLSRLNTIIPAQMAAGNVPGAVVAVDLAGREAQRGETGLQFDDFVAFGTGT